MFMGYSPAANFAVDAADFDGTNDYLTRASAFTGQADSKSGTFSVWLRFDVALSAGQVRGLFYGITAVANYWVAGYIVDNAPDDLWTFQAEDTGFNNVFISTDAGPRSTATWYHVLSSWNGATGAAYTYINDVAVSGGTVSSFNANANLAAINSWAVGVDPSNVANTKWDGGIAELYWAPGQPLDLSLSSNRRLFISATGKPVNLGTTGSVPTGSAPQVYLHLDDGESAANFATNRTGNGNFTVTGALTTYASSPSD